MRRESLATHNTVAILATGDEIIQGDILNSNSQIISQKLFNNGISVGIHMTVPDSLHEITQAIQYLLKNHESLIITGGLGPTSDDITRFALSDALRLPLLFDDNSWQSIENRFKKWGYSYIPENNRQQALFPKGATIIANEKGTANGCFITLNNAYIFMLPGPPFECLPMIDDMVLPTLKKAGSQEIQYYNHWLLFSVSEGEIAEKLDAIAKPFDCVTGYRVCYPYLEFKIYSNNQKDFRALIPLIEKAISPYLIGDGKQPASILLQKKLENIDFILNVYDTATRGLLQNNLTTPHNHAHLNFSHSPNQKTSPFIIIQGLDEFWQNQTNKNTTTISIHFSHETMFREKTAQIPFRGDRVKLYALEWICWQIIEFFNTF